MSWRNRVAGYCPTWAEVRFDVYLGRPEEGLADRIVGGLAELLIPIMRRR